MNASTKSLAAAALLESATNPTTVEQSRELFRQAQKDATDDGNIGILLHVCLRWADAETKRSQFKAAKRVYEDIVGHAELGNLAASWLSYAGFCAGRGKVRAARKIYVRGCQSKMSKEQSSTVWQAFLDFENAIRQSSSNSTTSASGATTDTPPEELIKHTTSKR